MLSDVLNLKNVSNENCLTIHVYKYDIIIKMTYGGVSVLTEIQVTGFKKFDKFKIDNLGRINLILGNNNVGKTSLLEAIFALSCGNNLEPFYNIIAMKQKNNIQDPMGMSAYDIGERIHTVFKNRSAQEYEFELSSKDINNKLKKFKHIVKPSQFMSFINTNAGAYNNQSEQYLTLPDGNKIRMINIAEWVIKDNGSEKVRNQVAVPQLNQFQNMAPAYNAMFLDILAHRLKGNTIEIYAQLKRNPRLLKEFLKEMTKIFPEVESLDLIPFKEGASTVSIIKTDGDILPIYQFGDGLQRWFNIIGSFVLQRDSIKLIEEIDATLHFEAQKEMGAYICQLSKEFNNQVFASSHSIEFVDNFLSGIKESSPEMLKDVRVITMVDDGSVVRSRVLNGEDAIQKREQFDLELR